MYSDKNYFLYTIFISIILMLSQSLLQSCRWSGLGKFCNLLILLFYPCLLYTLYLSYKNTNSKNNDHFKTRYIINTILSIIILMIWLLNMYKFIKKDPEFLN